MTPENMALIRLSGPDIEDNSVSADVLIRVLKGVQETVYVLGAANEGQPLQGRFRLSADLRQRYQLRCGVQREGSYAIPFTLGGPFVQLPLFPDKAPVTDQLYDLVRAVFDGVDHQLVVVLPDSRLRNLALRKFESALPRPGEHWRFGLSSRSNDEVVIDSQRARTIDQMIQIAEEPDTVMTVTGELIRIDFSQYKLFLRYPPTKRELECTYLPEIEDVLIDNRRDYIQVTGTYTLDQDGNPTSLTDVTRIEQIDLSQMVFDLVSFGDRALRLSPPLVIHPTLDEETKQLYMAVDKDLDLCAFAHSRESLVDEINEQLLFLWQTYAREDPDRLTEGAQRLRETLRMRMREVA